MRIALFSDIHCNAVALEAVLSSVQARGVDRMICLGDVAALGPQPRETLDLLRTHGVECIMGNHDASIIDSSSSPDPSHWVEEVTRWARTQFTPDDLEFIRSFADTLRIPLENGKELFCCHGSPRSNTEFITARVSSEGLAEMLHGITSQVIACGHAHVPLLRVHQERMVINVGSAGYSFRRIWQFGHTPRLHPWADYVILESHGDELSVQFNRLPLDMPAIRSAAQESDMPGVEEYLEMWKR